MTTVTELKALYVKLGGNAADVATIQTDAEMIEKIKEVAIPAELPSVTSEDNGKVLKVIEGAWNKGTDESLPSVTSTDAGKALIVDSEGAWGVSDIPSELPSVTSADEGDVLAVNSSGEWTAKTLEIGSDNVFKATVNTSIGNISTAYNISLGTTQKAIFDSINADNIFKSYLIVTDQGNEIRKYSCVTKSVDYAMFICLCIERDTNTTTTYEHIIKIKGNDTSTSIQEKVTRIDNVS